jgi:hypothetical protein
MWRRAACTDEINDFSRSIGDHARLALALAQDAFDAWGTILGIDPGFGRSRRRHRGGFRLYRREGRETGRGGVAALMSDRTVTRAAVRMDVEE